MTLSNILEVLSLMALKRWPAPLSSNRSLILHTFLQFNGFLYLAEYGSYKQWHPFPLGLQLRAGPVHPNPFLLTYKYTSHFILHGPSWSAQRTSCIVVHTDSACAPSHEEAGQFTRGPQEQCFA